MATALKAAREHLTCPLCKNNFDDPKTIVCLHTFCKNCISDYIVDHVKSINKPKGFECPLCKKETILSEFIGQRPEDWSAMLPTNEALSNILKAINTAENTSSLSCPRHSDKEVEFFCEEDEIFACSLCSTQSHKSCRRVNSLTEAVTKRKENIATLTADMTSQIAETEKVLNNRQDQIESLESREEDIKLEITEMKTQFNEFFSQMETKVLDAMAEIKHKESGLIQLEINLCHQIIRDATEAVKQLNKTDDIQNPINFVEKYISHLKSYEEREEKISNLLQNLTDIKIKYIANREIEKVLAEAINIGSLSMEKVRSKVAKPAHQGLSNEVIPKTLEAIAEDEEELAGVINTSRSKRVGVEVAHVSPMRATSMVSVGTTAEEDEPEIENEVPRLNLDESKLLPKISRNDSKGVFKACFLRDFNTAVDKQTESTIEGAAFLASGHIIMTDSFNKCMKLFDKSYKFLAMTKFSVSPGDIAVISDKELVVCLPETSRIKHEKIDIKNKKITAGEILAVGDRCSAVSYSNRKLACCSNSTVYVFKRHSSIWNPEATINMHVNNLKFVALDGTAERIVVTRDGYPNRSVICMTTSGLKLWAFTHEEIRLPRGVVFHGNKILIAVLDQKTVIQINGKDGRFDGCLIQEGLEWPWNLCISSNGDKMLLAQNHFKMGARDKSKALIFRLQKVQVQENDISP